MSITEAITLAIAVLGAVLGVINTWRAIDRDRIKIRVCPIWSFINLAGNMQTRFGVEITNLSSVPITVSQVGFLLSGDKEKQFVFMPECVDGGTFPRRMEPRTAMSALMTIGSEDNPTFGHVSCAFVTTACGKRITGTSPALRGLIQKHRSGKRGS